MEFPERKYGVIYADPPWSFRNKNTGGSMTSGASMHYNTMSLEALAALPVSQIASDDCILFMWWVASQPREAMMIAESWGFEIKTMTGFAWVKKTKLWKDWFGMGFYTRQGSENCLIAIKGKPIRMSASVRSVVKARAGKHSAKPAAVRDGIVELMGEVSRIELFARNRVSGWDAWGDEID